MAFASARLANIAFIFFNSCDKTYGLMTTDSQPHSQMLSLTIIHSRLHCLIYLTLPSITGQGDDHLRT
jgi:hypothetical protein